MSAVPMLVRCAIGQGLHLPWQEYQKVIMGEYVERATRPGIYDHDLTYELSEEVKSLGYHAYCYGCGVFFRETEHVGVPCRRLQQGERDAPRP